MEKENKELNGSSDINDVSKVQQPMMDSKNIDKDKKCKVNNKKVICIVLCIVGIVFLVLGVVLFVNKSNDDSGDGIFYEEEEGGDVEEKIEIATRNIKEFSNYRNYSVKKSEVVGSVSAISTADVDTINKVMNSSLNFYSSTRYIYYDLFNQMHYISDDNENWFKNENTVVSLPDYSIVINRVKSNVDVTDDGNGQFSFTSSAKVFGKLYNGIPTVVNFDKNGFLVKIKYDLSKLEEDGTESFVLHEFTNINRLGNLEIPENIIEKAIETEEVATIDFS